MKIKLDESNGKFEQRDLQYIQLLETDKIFEALVKRARVECGTDKKALSNYPSESIFLKAFTHAKQIIALYGLPSSWLYSLSDFIVMRKFPSPHSSIFISGLSTNTKNGLANDLTITIKQKASWDELKRWIGSHKETIKEHLEKLPPKNSKMNSNFEIKYEVFRLYREGLKPSQIEHKLLAKHEDNEDLYNQITAPNIS